MNCPYCNHEMEKGYIQSRNGLGWNKKKQLFSSLSCILSDHKLGMVVIAYRCKDCQKIVIDYAESEE